MRVLGWAGSRAEAVRFDWIRCANDDGQRLAHHDSFLQFWVFRWCPCEVRRRLVLMAHLLKVVVVGMSVGVRWGDLRAAGGTGVRT